MPSLKTIRCGFLLICAWLLLLMPTVSSANAQTLDTNPDTEILTTQLEQMQKEIQFLRRQIDTAAGVEARFSVLVERMTSAEKTVEQLSQKVKELTDLNKHKSKQIQLFEQYTATLPLDGITAAQQAIGGLEMSSGTGIDADFGSDTGAITKTLPNLIVEETATQVNIEAPAQPTAATAISATSLMDGALLKPGPIVPIVYRDEQGDISRPIPARRGKKDLDPQPLSEDKFERLRTQAIQTITETQTTGSSDSENGKTGKEESKTMDDTISAKSHSETTPDISPVQQQYDEAYALIERSEWLKAERALKEFLNDHPNHSLTSNANYWLGESFYARNLLNDATRIFAENVRDYRTGSKAPDSLLKLSIILATQEKMTEACRLLAFLPIEYPQANETLLMKAETETKRLGCS